VAAPAAGVRGEVTQACAPRGEVTQALPADLHVPVDRGAPVASIVLPDGTELGLFAGTNSVGRRSANDVVVMDAFMSGKHGEITVNPDGSAQFVDAGSTNGSYLNGQRLSPHSPIPLADGTVFTMGKTDVTYRASPPGGEAPQADDPTMMTDPSFETVRNPAPPPPGI
jgi:pSer/pThr/pTyr-binding forkhead associated (FHA) protein